MNPPTLIVPTNDPAATVAEYATLGYRWESLYVGRFYPALCQRKLYAVQLFKPEPPPPQQPTLL